MLIKTTIAQTQRPADFCKPYLEGSENFLASLEDMVSIPFRDPQVRVAEVSSSPESDPINPGKNVELVSVVEMADLWLVPHLHNLAGGGYKVTGNDLKSHPKQNPRSSRRSIRLDRLHGIQVLDSPPVPESE